MAEILNIITPCVNAYNVMIQKYFIEELASNTDWQIRWYIVYDLSDFPDIMPLDTINVTVQVHRIQSAESIVGNAQRNYALQLIEEGWVWFLDDDNLPHPKMNDWLSALMIDLALVDVSICGQQRERYGVFLQPQFDNIRSGAVDTAMMIARAGIAKQFTWQECMYEADGKFITELFNAHRSRAMVTQDVYAYYNRLKW